MLDTTGSMAGPKLTALKNASKTLVETAFEKPDADEHVKISLVPFAQYVNVGMEYRNASWMNVPADSSIAHDGCGFDSPVIGTSNCRTETFTGNNDGVPYSYESEVCDYEYGPPVYQCTPCTETITWNGCAGPRNYPLNTLDEQYEDTHPRRHERLVRQPHDTAHQRRWTARGQHRQYGGRSAKPTFRPGSCGDGGRSPSMSRSTKA